MSGHSADKDAPRLHVKCTYPGCTAAHYEFGGNHERANREAVKRGWIGDQRTGCLCVDTGTRCPDHARVTSPGEGRDS